MESGFHSSGNSLDVTFGILGSELILISIKICISVEASDFMLRLHKRKERFLQKCFMVPLMDGNVYFLDSLELSWKKKKGKKTFGKTVS